MLSHTDGQEIRPVHDRGFDLGVALPTLAAGRVRLRWLSETDVPSLFAIFGDPQVTRYYGHSTLSDLSAAVALLADIHEQFSRMTLFQWGVELTGTGAIIGTCTLASLNFEHRRAELGFALAQGYWGHGYMSEALRALLRFGFREMMLHRIWADTDPRNEPSIRTLERLEFRREGMLREHYFVQGERQDAIMYGLLKSDWRDQDGESNKSMSR